MVRGGSLKTSKLIEDLTEESLKHEAPVQDVRVGVSWTGVLGKWLGLAKTYGIPAPHGLRVKDWGSLTKTTTTELLHYAHSWNLIEASIGVAALNACMEPKGEIGNNALDILADKAKGKRVVVIGNFPYMEKVRRAASEFWVLELDPSLQNPANGVIASTASEYVIPDSHIVAITGSTLINKSLDRLLELTREAKAYTIVMGPSTPLSEVLFDYGVHLIASAEVLKPNAILERISQGSGMLTPNLCKGEIAFRVMEKP